MKTSSSSLNSTQAAVLVHINSGGLITPRRAFPLGVDEFLALALWLKDLAERTGVRIAIVDPSGTKLVVFTAGSILICAAMGGLMAGLPGVVLGVGAGLLAGYAAAHVRLTWDGSAGSLSVAR